MLVVETIAKIRRAYFSLGKPIKEICRELRVSRKVVRKVIRSDATEFHYERSRQPLPRIGPWRERLESLLEANEGKAARERLTLIRLYEELRGFGYEGSYAAVRRYAIGWREKRASETAGAYVPLIIRAGRSLPVRLEPRDRCDGRGDDDREGRARPSLPQPHDARARLSARDAGDGVRRPRAGVRILQGRLHARHLRQHEDGGGDDLHRQGPAIQSPLPPDVLASSRRARRLHASLGLGERPGRKSGRSGSRALLHAALAGQKL